MKLAPWGHILHLRLNVADHKHAINRFNKTGLRARHSLSSHKRLIS
jgi:hypothetical protein